MTLDQVAVLRSFNRSVTERIGALQDDYLSRSRPLGASRLLWEIGPKGSDVRTLRGRLGLDSGYLSRLLRSLEHEGLITTSRDGADARVRTIELTDLGRREWADLDELSDELVLSILEPLSNDQRKRLAQATATVERLLTAGLVDVRLEHPASETARFCIGEYFNELDQRFDTGFDPAKSISADSHELTLPSGLLLVAWLREHPVGCGALKLHGSAPAEVKRMWVAPDARGLGLGRRILRALEDEAIDRDVSILRLETNKTLDEAISLYRSAGYQEVDPFNDEPFAHHWFEKKIG
jgi:DNA-binding MarR family transcriptional regulator/GNAT superfamily N-acetyltransferase